MTRLLQTSPYGITACKWDTVIEFAPMWKEVKRVLKPNGAFITTASQPFTSALVMSNPKFFKYEWIWNKVTARGHLVAKKRPMAQHENILVFGNGKSTYNPQMIERPRDKIEVGREMKRSSIIGGVSSSYTKTYTHWYPKTVLEYTNAGSSVKSIHPTQKPVALYEYLIKTYTNECETVLDIAMGSGTTIEAAERTGRNSIGIEKDNKIFETAKTRIESMKP